MGGAVKFKIIFLLLTFFSWACAKEKSEPQDSVTHYSLAYGSRCENCRIEYKGEDGEWVIYDTTGGVTLYPPATLNVLSGFEATIKATAHDSTKISSIELLAIDEHGDTTTYQIDRPDYGVYYTELNWTAP